MDRPVDLPPLVEEGSNLHSLLKQIAPEARVFQCLDGFPAETTDIEVVLVDDCYIVHIEVLRGAQPPIIEGLERTSLQTYRQGQKPGELRVLESAIQRARALHAEGAQGRPS